MPVSLGYGPVAILLHWLIAALIIVNLTLGLYSQSLRGLDKIGILQPHKSIGVAILLLSLLRLGWRLGHRPPPFVGLASWERRLANAAHVAFYVLMIAVPLAGWAMVSASPLAAVFPIKFGLFNCPLMPFVADLPIDRKAVAYKAFQLSHEVLAKSFIPLLALHIAGALKHQWMDRTNILARMMPFLGRPTGA